MTQGTWILPTTSAVLDFHHGFVQSLRSCSPRYGAGASELGETPPRPPLPKISTLSFRKMFVGGLSWQTTPGKGRILSSSTRIRLVPELLHSSALSVVHNSWLYKNINVTSPIWRGPAHSRLQYLSFLLSEGLREYFSKFGQDIRECMVMRDPITKRSRYVQARCGSKPSFILPVPSRPYAGITT